MDQHDDFDNVSWKHDADSDVSRPTTSGTDVEESHRHESYDHDANGKRRMSSALEEPQAGPLADAVDLAGIGDGVLECRVDSPMKENDGTKDAYISYLVTTNVRARSFDLRERGVYCCLHSLRILRIWLTTQETSLTLPPLDRLQSIPKARVLCSEAIYRFLFLVQNPLS